MLKLFRIHKILLPLFQRREVSRGFILNHITETLVAGKCAYLKVITSATLAMVS
jgi:hypothetical protein